MYSCCNPLWQVGGGLVGPTATGLNGQRGQMGGHDVTAKLENLQLVVTIIFEVAIGLVARLEGPTFDELFEISLDLRDFLWYFIT